MRPLALTTSTTLALLALTVFAACDSDSPVQADGASAPDAGTDGAANNDALAPDLGGPLANVYPHNPVVDKKQTSKVPLRYITDKQGKLTGKYAEVWNCLNKDGGEKISINIGLPLTGKMCVREQAAKPGQDGSYLQIIPPASDVDGSDSFAEVMMYYHINQIHDYYADTLKLSHIKDMQMLAIVNLQVYADLLAQWIGMMNAMYVPKGTGDMFKLLLGVDLTKGRDALLFIQDAPNILFQSTTVDTSYEASVIYHEYTHAAIGAGALWAPGTDTYGLDPTPRGLNEALADYFAASLLDDPVIGSYAMAAYGGGRDLTRSFKCPDHIVGEEHVDGEVASGALWAVRKLLGVKIADQAIWNAVLTFGMTTTFEQAATAILAEVVKAAPSHQAAVKKIFEDHGLIGCVRLMEHKDISGAGATTAPAYAAAMAATFPGGTPAFMQYKLNVKSTTQEITIEYTPANGSGIPGMPAGKGDVSVALSPGSAPITYNYSSGKGISTAKAVLKGVDAGAGYTLVLSGSCVKSGDLVYQFLNNGAAGGSVKTVTITQSDTKTNTTDNFDGC